METLLINDFTKHYKLSIPTQTIISAQTNVTYFELKDDNHLIYQNIDSGLAKYQNINSLYITVINYEAFINTLPHKFIQNREKCDLIVISENNQYFLLNELTDTVPQYVNPFTNSKGLQPGKRNKAIKQLLKSLTDLLEVVSIKSYINYFY